MASGKTNASAKVESVELITVTIKSSNHNKLLLSYVDPEQKVLKNVSLYPGYNQNIEMSKDSIIVFNDRYGYGIRFSASSGTTEIELSASTALTLFVSDNTEITVMDG